METLILIGGLLLIGITALIAFVSRFRRCPSDKILVIYGKVGNGKSSYCLHGGMAFVWPVLQDYQYLDLTPIPIDIKLEGALSKQNIRVNTPSTFMIGISTEPGIMENAAERLLGLDMNQIKELAKDIIFGQMRVVIATMDIEEINADRDKLVANISMGVEVELKKVGLRLINVNIQDITDSSGYIDALGQEAASIAINEAKVKVALANRDGEIGSAEAQRDMKISVAAANASATTGENSAKVAIANSNAERRTKEAEAERLASAAEKVAQAKALEESYLAEERAERQRSVREKATQEANIIIPAQIEREKAIVEAEAEAERTRRAQAGHADAVRLAKQAEADGIRMVKEAEATGLKLRLIAEADGNKAHLLAEAEGTRARLLAEAEGAEALLKKKAEGFRDIIASTGGAESARQLLLTEQLPALVHEQVKAVSNLKIDKITVWDSGKGENGKSSTADFVSGLAGSLPPLHDLAKNAGVDLPGFMGKPSEESKKE